MAYNEFVENFPDYNIHVILCAYTKEEFDSANKIKSNEKIIKSEDYLMNKINHNKITIDEFLKLDEKNLMLITNPGRMENEDGSYFIMKDNDKFVAYRISGWMYGQKEPDSVSFDMMCSHFPKWKEAFEKAEKKEIYLGGCEVFVGLEQPIYHCYNCNNNFYKDLVNYEKVNGNTQVNIELPFFINKKDSSKK